LAWQASTSAVEQGFSKADRLQSGGRTPAAEAHERKVLQLVLSKPGSDSTNICRHAQQLFARCAPGHVRGRVTARIDKGVKRPSCDPAAETMAGWLKRRRQAVSTSVRGTCPMAGTAPDPDVVDPAWGDGHEAELAFQNGKHTNNKINAFLDGSLLDSEIDPELPALAAARSKNEVRLDAAQIAVVHKNQTNARLMHRTVSLDELSGKTAWVNRRSLTPEALQSIVNDMASLNMIRAADRYDANVFVVADASEPGERVLWHAVLRGAMVIDAAVILGGTGVIMNYKSAVRQARSLWISPEFLNSHSEVGAIITQAIALPTSKWKLVDDQQTIFQKAKPSFFYVNLMVSGQAGPRRYVTNSFLNSCRQLDDCKSGLGSINK